MQPQVCTLESFKNLEINQQPTVESAKKIGTIKIVSYDWLEDSLLSNAHKPKSEGPYLLKNLMKPEKNEVQNGKATKNSTKVIKDIKAKVPKRPIGMYQFAGAPLYWYNPDDTDFSSIADPFLGLKGKKKRRK